MVKAKRYLFFLLNGGLDPACSDLVELRERRILASFISLLLIVGLVIVVGNMLSGVVIDNYSIALGLLTSLTCIFLQAHYGARILAANLMLFSLWMMPSANLINYGVQGTAMMWLLPQPAIAVLLVGRKTGSFWAIICCVTIAIFGYLHSQGLIEFSSIWLDYVPAVGRSNTFAAIVVICALTASSIVFRSVQKSTEEKLNSLVAELKGEVLSRRLAEEDAKLSEQSKTAFLAAMSHEIRTPLNGVISATRLLVDSEDEREKAEYSDIVLGSSETLLELVSDVMDLSAMDSGKLNISPVAMRLREVVEEATRPFYFQAKEKGIDFTTSISDDVPDYIFADKTRAKQILINLVGNAIKFTSHGEVSVHIKTELNKIVLSVQDSGIGISDEEKNKLFEPFAQANSSTKNNFGGTGLGLTIVKKIVSAVGGNIVLSSEKGKGSTFTVYIPHVVPNERSIAAAEHEESKLAQIAPLDLLVADDNAVNRMVLTRLLESDNHNVVAVNDGEEALNYIKAHDVDAVLMDIQMPVMNGKQAAAEIRNLSGSKSKTIIIAVTANTSSTDANKLLAASFDGFLAKPFRKEELAKALKLTQLH